MVLGVPMAAAGEAGHTGQQLAVNIEVMQGATGSGLQPPAAKVETVVPPASAAAPKASTAVTAPAASVPAATDSADPAETASTSAPEPAPPPASKLVIVGWGGAYGQALKRAVYDPFHDDTQIELETQTATSASSLPPSAVAWDVADVSPLVAQQGCRSGALAEMGGVQLAAGALGAPAAQDFLDGSLSRCAVGSFAWSSVVVIDPRAFRKGAPETLADIFDGKRFKQKRAFARSPRYLLEMALLADGVAPNRVYGELSTRAGLKRAFKKLDGIRKTIVWTPKPEIALQLMSRGEAAITTAYSGRAFYALASELKPYKLIWDGQVYDLSVWVVSSKSAAKDKAQQFVSFATRPDRLAAVARWFPYGPVRLSALNLVGTHPTLGLDLNPFLPTTPANMTSALRFNEAFWQANETMLTQSLEAWIAGKPPLPEAEPAAGSAARGN